MQRSATIDEEQTTPWWKVWPYTRHSAAYFMAAFVTMTAAWTITGWAVVRWFEPSRWGSTEAELSARLADNRTSTWNDLATVASIPSNTPVKIVLMAMLFVGLPLLWRRWHEWAFLAGALLLEVGVYGLASFIVGRARPPVERLAEAPTQSWPSGHVAAALTFYVGVAIVINWRTDNSLATWTSRIAATLIVIAMAVSRLYLGMHYVSDLIGGVALGATALAVTHPIMRSGLRQRIESRSEPCPSQTLALQTTNDTDRPAAQR